MQKQTRQYGRDGPTTGLMHRSKLSFHSINSVAAASSVRASTAATTGLAHERSLDDEVLAPSKDPRGLEDNGLAHESARLRVDVNRLPGSQPARGTRARTRKPVPSQRNGPDARNSRRSAAR